jgi:hypothetical protein
MFLLRSFHDYLGILNNIIMDPFTIQYRRQIDELNEEIAELVEALEIYDEILEYIDPVSESMLIAEAKDKKWIQKAIKKPGALHKALKVKKGEKIPEGKLDKAAHKGGKLGRRARLAKTLRNLSKDKVNEEVGGPVLGVVYNADQSQDLVDQHPPSEFIPWDRGFTKDGEPFIINRGVKNPVGPGRKPTVLDKFVRDVQATKTINSRKPR